MPKVAERLAFSLDTFRRPYSTDSILASLTNIGVHPSILLFGPTKAGKTRLAVWEACKQATVLNRRVLGIFVESNMETPDFLQLLAMCAHHRVACEFVKINHIRSLRYYIKNLVDKLSRGVKKDEAELWYRVYVVDSLTGMSELVLHQLGPNLLDNPRTFNVYFNAWQMDLIDAIRRLVSDDMLAGYMFMVAHETKKVGDKEVSDNPVNAKPRYSNEARYKTDLELYLTNAIPEKLVTKKVKQKARGRPLRALVVASARRAQDDVGAGLLFVWKTIEGEAEGVLLRATSGSRTVYMYVPADMIEEEIKMRESLNETVDRSLYEPQPFTYQTIEPVPVSDVVKIEF